MRKRVRSGFTLVEMLVVITVLMILASLLLPALNQALESSRNTHCLNNLRQQYVGLAMYAGDFREFLPNSPRWWSAGGGVLSHYAAAGASCGQYLAYANNYLGIKTTPSGDNDFRAEGRNDVLTCPGISPKVPASVWATAGMVEYIIGLGGSEVRCSGGTVAPNARMSKIGKAESKGQKALAFDVVSYDPGSTSPWINQYMNGHKQRGGNVLAGGGSARWEPSTTYPQWELSSFGNPFSGEGINLPIEKYYVYRGPCGWNTKMIWYSPGINKGECEGAPPLFR